MGSQFYCLIAVSKTTETESFERNMTQPQVAIISHRDHSKDSSSSHKNREF